MTRRTVHLPVAAQDSLADITDIAERAETLGYDRVWFPETWGRDAATTLTAIADRTTDIGIGTSIINTYSRSPALVGQTAATLQEHSGGRFRLGMGPSGPAVIQGWHGQSFERPLRRTREYIDVVRAVLTGDPVDYDGDLIQTQGFRLRQDAPDPAPAIDVTGMGPKAVELAGRFADGWHALLFTADGIRERLADLRRGMDLGDRDADAVQTTLVVPCCAQPDAAAARDLTRQHLAFYVGGMGEFYRDSLARQGYEAPATDVYDAWQDGDHERAVGLVTDDLLDAFAAAGTQADVRDRLAAFAGIDGVDAVAVSFPRAADNAVIDDTLAAVAPAPAHTP
ncbi:TIGR04024 family LLM class F420-dependent oxidoreductase [Halobacterium salinarum]|nr:TIGR04024 family LLM class F420-dependent oxidoreductase [Halobacterium salinarum]MBB6088679.1 coenzyme F420-dependent oxidoreductase [Halobacterium salinarum]MDL0118913.1 TIGR04024 family LLM class F420-dependent oxidoreductase [Halobacterium salinarum]MDL0130025.1 TIGR04024 family LLM class F420-dependent oxidoreductase [Halobacterium salinarum]MDL0142080.1 TIGR04024 family LLM class F420-dependent oxidoreductase [Halobacterium salinarum]MDL0145409.1 TIGR04024 family LLM class F420-depend